MTALSGSPPQPDRLQEDALESARDATLTFRIATFPETRTQKAPRRRVSVTQIPPLYSVGPSAGSMSACRRVRGEEGPS